MLEKNVSVDCTTFNYLIFLFFFGGGVTYVMFTMYIHLTVFVIVLILYTYVHYPYIDMYSNKLYAYRNKQTNQKMEIMIVTAVE